MYSSAERVLGELLTPRQRAHAVLATKVWTSGARSGIEQMTHSAQLPQTPRLDLIQVHNLLDLADAAEDAACLEGRGSRALHRRHPLHGSAHAGTRARHSRRAAWTSCSSTTRRSPARRRRVFCRSPPSAASRCWSIDRSRTARCFRSVRERALPAWAGDIDAGELGTAGVEIHRLAPGGDLRDSRHREAYASARQPRRRPRAAAGRAAARDDCQGLQFQPAEVPPAAAGLLCACAAPAPAT